MPELVINGLDGANPLAFFAALGTLPPWPTPVSPAASRGSSEAGGSRRFRAAPVMCQGWLESWTKTASGAWVTPRSSSRTDGKRDLKPPPGVYHDLLESLAASEEPRIGRSLAWASAFATDVAVDNNGNTKPTAFHFTAGQQQFLAMTRESAGAHYAR